MSQRISEPDSGGVRYYESQSGYSRREAEDGGEKKPRRTGLIIFICIVIALIVLGVACSQMTASWLWNAEGGESSVNLPSSPYIAKMYVEGTIAAGSTDTWGNPLGYQHRWTLEQIDHLIYDYNNEGLILFVNSPGGGVYESDELYFKIKEYQEKTGNPVYAAMGSMAASGGYYISAPADKIVANRNCWTGSIGVTIGTLVDVSGLLENYGVKTTTIASGRNKSMGGYFEPLTEEQRAIFQSLIDEAYDQFTGIVAEERDMDINAVKRIADGRIYTAKQALDLGLIDSIGTLDEAVDDMQDSYNLYGADVVDIYYVNTSLLGRLLGMAVPQNRSGESDIGMLMTLLEAQSQFPVSYLCEALL